MLVFPHLYKTPTLKIVTWSGGGLADLAAMIAAADAGEIDLSDYWKVGNSRSITLSAMAATGVGETHESQSVSFVVMDTGANSGYKQANGKPVNLVVGIKHCLKEKGYMNSTSINTGSWDSCDRRTWCNEVFRASIPEDFRKLFKQFKTITGSETNDGTLTTSLDYFSLFAEKEVFGARTNSPNAEADALNQIKYYETESYRIKNVDSTAAVWKLRSPCITNTRFCTVSSGGGASTQTSSTVSGIAPFGCI